MSIQERQRLTDFKITAIGDRLTMTTASEKGLEMIVCQFRMMTLKHCE
jgi:hypothetical protein